MIEVFRYQTASGDEPITDWLMSPETVRASPAGVMKVTLGMARVLAGPYLRKSVKA